jgi:hypothetical protein
MWLAVGSEAGQNDVRPRAPRMARFPSLGSDQGRRQLRFVSQQFGERMDGSPLLRSPNKVVRQLRGDEIRLGDFAFRSRC